MRLLVSIIACLSVVMPMNGKSKSENCRIKSGNPVFAGFYADPHAMIYGKTYWVYPTTSLAFSKQTSMDCFSSSDLVNWTRHENILSSENIAWIKNALWAPAAIEKDGMYYLFFGANNIPYGDTVGGIGVAVAECPEGPYRDLIGAPLIGSVANGAQPIDQCLFRDDDGSYYMYYGGWGHCNVVKLRDDFKGLQEFEVGGTVYNQAGGTDPDKVRYLEVTPLAEPKYTEGSFMIKRGDKYYFMWSEGGFTNATYNVAYAISDSPFGPFERRGTVLLKDESIGSGAGHHSLVNIPGTDDWYIFYHRRADSRTPANDREVCVERLYFDENGDIIPVSITRDGVCRRKIK